MKMISELVFRKSSEWKYTNISWEDIRKNVPWLNIPCKRWPPHHYGWSVCDDIENVFYISQGFETSNELKSWLFAEKNILENEDLKFVIEFIYGSIINNSQNEKIRKYILFREILERSIFWWNPDHSWPNHYFLLLLEGQNDLLEINQSRFEFNKEVDNTFGGYYFSRDSYTHIFSKVKKYSYEIFKYGKSEYSELDLFLQSKYALKMSINEYFHWHVRLSHLDFEFKLDEIIEKEILWCNKRYEELNIKNFTS